MWRGTPFVLAFCGGVLCANLWATYYTLGGALAGGIASLRLGQTDAAGASPPVTAPLARAIVAQPLLGRCNASTPGIWHGLSRPFQWQMEDPSCAYTVSTAGDFLREFDGKRVLFIGDSTTRELARDTMRAVIGCGKLPKYGYSLEDHHGYQFAPQSAQERAHCDRLTGYDPQGHFDFNVSVVNPSTKRTIHLQFLWLQWPSQALTKRWWNDTVLAGRFDVALFNFYLHIVSSPEAGGNPHWYGDELAWLTAALHATPPLVRDMLHRRFYWRSTFPGEWWQPHYPLFRRQHILRYSALAQEHMLGAGFPVLVADKYFNHSTCSATISPASTEGCLTADGDHPTITTNLVIAREFFSVVADRMAQEIGRESTGEPGAAAASTSTVAL